MNSRAKHLRANLTQILIQIPILYKFFQKIENRKRGNTKLIYEVTITIIKLLKRKLKFNLYHEQRNKILNKLLVSNILQYIKDTTSRTHVDVIHYMQKRIFI